jgi:hypothetical protein
MGQLFGANCCPKIFGKLFYGFMPFPGGDQFYMVGIVAVCWGIWTLQNRVTFEKYITRNPTQVVFTVCSFLLYWTRLQKEGDKEILGENTRKLMKVAAEMAEREEIWKLWGCARCQ